METHKEEGRELHSELGQDLGGPRLVHIVDEHSLVVPLLDLSRRDNEHLEVVETGPEQVESQWYHKETQYLA